MSGRKYLSDEEIARLASTMRVADPDVDNGAFDSVKRNDALVWLKLLGVQGLFPNSPISEEDAKKRLRGALWDVQRLDYLFPGANLADTGTLGIDSLPAWPNWEDPHPELRSDTLGVRQLDGYKDANRLDSYVFRHFQLSAFTQIENMTGSAMNAPKDIRGAWDGAKVVMVKAATDITREGGKDTPFVSYIVPDSQIVLIMEILEVKECAWPEPSEKLMGLIRTCQETKFGHPASGPLVPMLRTPKFPLVIVRYSYMEGRPKGGSQFTLHLEERLRKMVPGTSAKAAREKLQYHMGAAEDVAETHLRMFARLLSFNSELVDRRYVSELQSHWKGVTQDVIKETKISFFVPCLRMRFRTLEQIETGITMTPPKLCNACGKEVEKTMCAACKSVFYCNGICNKADWPKHKADCKFSKRILENDPTLPTNKLYVPTRTYVDFVLEHGFAVEQEAIKLCGLAPVGDCPVNEYGSERFIVRTQAPPDYTVAGGFKGQTVFLFDRRRSFQLRTGPGDPVFAVQTKMNISIPFHAEGHKKLMRLLAMKGIQRQQVDLWGRRVGDCLELDLEDLPSPNLKEVSW